LEKGSKKKYPDITSKWSIYEQKNEYSNYRLRQYWFLFL
jgi:hypothetical protein